MNSCSAYGLCSDDRCPKMQDILAAKQLKIITDKEVTERIDLKHKQCVRLKKIKEYEYE